MSERKLSILYSLQQPSEYHIGPLTKRLNDALGRTQPARALLMAYRGRPGVITPVLCVFEDFPLEDDQAVTKQLSSGQKWYEVY